MVYETFVQMKKMLTQLDAWLEMATAYATSKKFDAKVLLDARLAPDQFPLSRQVQIACDTAKLGAARLTGKDAPSHPDTEQSIDELRTRVKSVVDWLGTLSAKDFADIASRSVTQPRWEGKTMNGPDYFMEHVVPNFFFHLTHVYALLRHSGMTIGKRDYLGQLTMQPPKA